MTLIELMVVVAIVGLLMVAAVMGTRESAYSGGSYGYSNVIAGECDTARLRAVSNRRWQQLQVTATQVTHWEATTTGMAPPVAWQLVRTLNVPADVFVNAMDMTTHINQNTGVPGAGVGLPGTLNFAPDGSAQAATIFVGDNRQDNYRVIVYRATGTAFVYEEW